MVTGAARLSAIGHSLAREPEEARVTEQSAERRPIGWWLKTADARIEQAFADAFESQSIARREWQVLEPVSRAPVPEVELLQKLEAFAGAQDAVDELRGRGLLADGADGVLTLTDAGESRTAGRPPASRLFGVLSGPHCPERATPPCSGY
jgi:hypothetical protein